MKSLTLLLIPLLFFMTWCSIDWNDEKDAKIAELEKQVTELQAQKNKATDDIFEKNKECRNLEKEASIMISKGSEVYSLFYSPVKKSCLVAYVTYEEVSIWDISRDVPNYIIRDVLTLDWIFKEVDYPWFEKLMTELKWNNP